MFHGEDESFLERYQEWEEEYDAFLSRVESDAYEGGTLLNVVSGNGDASVGFAEPSMLISIVVNSLSFDKAFLPAFWMR